MMPYEDNEDACVVDMLFYNPSQPREPKGSPGGGRWTSGGARARRASIPKSRIARGLTAERTPEERKSYKAYRVKARRRKVMERILRKSGVPRGKADAYMLHGQFGSKHAAPRSPAGKALRAAGFQYKGKALTGRHWWE